MSEQKDWTKEEIEKEYIGEMTAVTIPVNLHLDGKQHILSLVEMKDILEEASVISVGECGCRTRVKTCDAPLDVCLSLDEAANDAIKRGSAKKVSLKRALEVLKRSHDAGLVHITYTFKDDERPRYVCSCCSCCCHSMSGLVRFRIPEAVVASKYVVTHNYETCINCGTCVERCQFKARRMEDNEMVFDKTRCFGCGVCTSTCPTDSNLLVKRKCEPLPNALL
ncbi:MAG: 4Fe-4S binding protein [Candidatus Bathyarchaeota archaeon]|nr:MAG: 4Fe-4S binding protein [Candidatus Bathyarchaeota archaeon]